MIITKQYDKIEINEKEILRYSGCYASDEAVNTLMQECISEIIPIISPRLCYTEIGRDEIFEFFTYCETDAAFRTYMAGSDRAILFAASIGQAFDRMISRYERLSVSKAQMMQAIGVQQVEGLCDMFCDEILCDHPDAKPRFSPGYGGLRLESQKYVFSLLDCTRKIGLSLNESLLISPSKSVTAIIALPD